MRTADRINRAIHLVRTTRRSRGWLASMTLAARVLRRKAPLYVRHLRAVGRVKGLRLGLETAREELGPNRAPLLAFVVSGGLGDLLVIARFVRDLEAAAGGFLFDVFAPAPAIASWVFRDVPGFCDAFHDLMFDHVTAEYDLAVRANQCLVVYREHINWRVVRRKPVLTNMVDSLVRVRPRIDIFVNHHPWLDNHLARSAVFSDESRRTWLHFLAGLEYGSDRMRVPMDESILNRINVQPGGYMTVHNGFDTGFVISGRRATKCYPHFGAVVTHLRAALPGMRFIQIGAATSQKILECDRSLINETSLDEAAALIGGAALHLDNEGGLVHLAACLGTRAAVVFGPTPSDYFGYPGNINIDPPECGNCWWMTRTWMDFCAKGHLAPPCMTEQNPRLVALRVIAAMGQADPSEPERHAAAA